MEYQFGYNIKDGRRGPMWVTDLVELIRRNAYRSDVRFLHERVPSSQNLAPKETFTIAIGPASNGWFYNVPRSQAPEFTVLDDQTGMIVHRGWRSLLKMLLEDKVIRPSREVADTLGKDDFGRSRTVEFA